MPRKYCVVRAAFLVNSGFVPLLDLTPSPRADILKARRGIVTEENMALGTVADLTVEQFKDLMRQVVLETLGEALGDPDEGLELRDDIKVHSSFA